MILGKLFETIFLEEIKVIISTNIKASELYKDGLQRDQFLPFINIIEKNSTQKELLLDDKKQKIFYPINEKTLLNINKNF